MQIKFFKKFYLIQKNKLNKFVNCKFLKIAIFTHVMAI